MRTKSFKSHKYFSIRDYLKSKKLLEEKEYYNIVFKELFKAARDILIEKEILKLPYLGTFKLVRYKPKNKKVDFGLSKKLGKTVYHTNFHSQRQTYRISWIRNAVTKNYVFKAYRGLNRTLSKKLKGNGKY